jgi:hypothetical protein
MSKVMYIEPIEVLIRIGAAYDTYKQGYLSQESLFKVLDEAGVISEHHASLRLKENTHE